MAKKMKPFTHDTKYSDIPQECFLRAASLEGGMAVLFQEPGPNGMEFGVAIFESSGRCRNVDKSVDFRKVLDGYLNIVKIDSALVKAKIEGSIAEYDEIRIKKLQDLGILAVVNPLVKPPEIKKPEIKYKYSYGYPSTSSTGGVYYSDDY